MKIGLAFARRFVRRRTLLKATPALAFAAWPAGFTRTVSAGDRNRPAGAETEELKMADAPRTPTTKVTVERRAQIVLIGINRPEVHNRVDPETYSGLAKAFYRYDRDLTLRAAVLWGHGDNFSRGIDVDAYQAVAASGRSLLSEPRSSAWDWISHERL
jgi:enoyl-CoA hydratase